MIITCSFQVSDSTLSPPSWTTNDLVTTELCFEQSWDMAIALIVTLPGANVNGWSNLYVYFSP